jgi:hypothetical protein
MFQAAIAGLCSLQLNLHYLHLPSMSAHCPWTWFHPNLDIILSWSQDVQCIAADQTSSHSSTIFKFAVQANSVTGLLRWINRY